MVTMGLLVELLAEVLGPSGLLWLTTSLTLRPCLLPKQVDTPHVVVAAGAEVLLVVVVLLLLEVVVVAAVAAVAQLLSDSPTSI